MVIFDMLMRTGVQKGHLLHTHSTPLSLVRAWRELHGSTSEMDSIAKSVIFYAGGQCTLRP